MNAISNVPGLQRQVRTWAGMTRNGPLNFLEIKSYFQGGWAEMAREGLALIGPEMLS